MATPPLSSCDASCFPPFSLDPTPPRPLPLVRLFFHGQVSGQYMLTPVLTTACFNESVEISPTLHLRTYSGETADGSTVELFNTLYNIPAMVRRGVPVPEMIDTELSVWRRRDDQTWRNIADLTISQVSRRSAATKNAGQCIMRAMLRPIETMSLLTKTLILPAPRLQSNKSRTYTDNPMGTMQKVMDLIAPGISNIQRHHLLTAYSQGVPLQRLRDAIFAAAENWREHCVPMGLIRCLDGKPVCAVQTTLDPLPLCALVHGGFTLDTSQCECGDGTALHVHTIGWPLRSLTEAVLFRVYAIGKDRKLTRGVMIRIMRETSVLNFALVSFNVVEDVVVEGTDHVNLTGKSNAEVFTEILTRLYPTGTLNHEVFLALLRKTIRIHIEASDCKGFALIECDNVTKWDATISDGYVAQFQGLDQWKTFGKDSHKDYADGTAATTVLSVPRRAPEPKELKKATPTTPSPSIDLRDTIFFPPVSLDPTPPRPLPLVQLFFHGHISGQYMLVPMLTTACFNDSVERSPTCQFRTFSGTTIDGARIEGFHTLYNIPAMMGCGVPVPEMIDTELSVWRQRDATYCENIAALTVSKMTRRSVARKNAGQSIMRAMLRPIGKTSAVTQDLILPQPQSESNKSQTYSSNRMETVQNLVSLISPGTSNIQLHHIPRACTRGVPLEGLRDAILAAAKDWREHCVPMGLVRILDKKLVCAQQRTLDPLPLCALAIPYGGFTLDTSQCECGDGTALHVYTVGWPLNSLKDAVAYRVHAIGVDREPTRCVMIRVAHEEPVLHFVLVSFRVVQGVVVEGTDCIHLEHLSDGDLYIEILKRLYPAGTAYSEAFGALLKETIHIQVEASDCKDFLVKSCDNVLMGCTSASASWNAMSDCRIKLFQELDEWKTFGKDGHKDYARSKARITGATTVLSVPRRTPEPKAAKKAPMDWSVQAIRSSEERKSHMLGDSMAVEKKARIKSILANGCFWRGCKAGKFTQDSFWVSMKCDAGHTVKFHEVCLLNTKRGVYLELGAEAANDKRCEKWSTLACVSEGCNSTLIEMTMRVSTHRKKKIELVKVIPTTTAAAQPPVTAPVTHAPRLDLSALTDFQDTDRHTSTDLSADTDDDADEKVLVTDLVPLEPKPKNPEPYFADLKRTKEWKAKTRRRRTKPVPQSLEEFAEYSDIDYPKDVASVVNGEQAIAEEDGIDLSVTPEIDKSYLDWYVP